MKQEGKAGMYETGLTSPEFARYAEWLTKEMPETKVLYCTPCSASDFSTLLVSLFSGVSFVRIKDRDFKPVDLAEASRKMEGLPIFVDQTYHLTTEELERKIVKMNPRPDQVVIDDAGRIRSFKGQTLKSVGKRLKVPIVTFF